MVWSHNQEVSVEFYCYIRRKRRKRKKNAFNSISAQRSRSPHLRARVCVCLSITSSVTPHHCRLMWVFPFHLMLVCAPMCTLKIICQPHFGQSALFSLRPLARNLLFATQLSVAVVRRQKPNICRIDSNHHPSGFLHRCVRRIVVPSIFVLRSRSLSLSLSISVDFQSHSLLLSIFSGSLVTWSPLFSNINRLKSM